MHLQDHISISKGQIIAATGSVLTMFLGSWIQISMKMAKIETKIEVMERDRQETKSQVERNSESLKSIETNTHLILFRLDQIDQKNKKQ